MCLHLLLPTCCFRAESGRPRKLKKKLRTGGGVCKVLLCQKKMCGRWRGAWARGGWRVWDLGNGTIMLRKLFSPEWQITSKSFLLSSFLIGFSFSPTAEISRLELEFEKSLPRKTWQESNGVANQEKQIFSLCQISPSASSTRDLGTRLCNILYIRAQESLSNDQRAVHSSGYALHISHSPHVILHYSLKLVQANPLQ